MAENQAKEPKGGDEDELDSGYSPKSVFRDAIVFTSRKSATNAIRWPSSNGAG